MNPSPSHPARRLFLAALGAPLLRSFAAPGMSARVDGEELLILAPDFHFIGGKPLQRLHDGVTLLFLTQLSLSTDQNATVARRIPQRFAVSYDIWEERFSVTRVGSPARSQSNLTAIAAERWCLDNLGLNVAGIAPDRPFWLRLEMRVADPRDQNGVVGEGGINLTKLIEIFSRPPASSQTHWTIEAGPLRLDQLRRGARG